MLIFSVILSLLILTVGTLLVKVGLFKITWHITIDTIILQPSTGHDVMKILKGKNKTEVRKLIKSQEQNLGKCLRIINIHGARNRAERREINSCFMNCLMEVQLSRKNALLCLKTQVDFATCNTIISDWNFTGTKLQTVVEKTVVQMQSTQNNLAQWINDKFHYVIKKGFKITYSGLESLLLVTLAYLDLSLDLVLLLSILIALGSTILDYTLFSSQVVYLLCASIIFPALATATTIAFRWPHVVIGSDDLMMCTRSDIVFDKKKLVVLRILIIGLSPMVPALVIMSDLRANHKRKELNDKLQEGDTMSQTSAIEESESITQFINECRLALLTFKRNELSLELVVQLSIHITMVLLTLTDYPVESGLQSIFKVNCS